jgi:hypothetical protein
MTFETDGWLYEAAYFQALMCDPSLDWDALIWLITQIQRKDQRSAAQEAGSEVTHR